MYIHCAVYNLNLVVDDEINEIIKVQPFFDCATTFGNLNRWNMLSILKSKKEEENLISIILRILNPTT